MANLDKIILNGINHNLDSFTDDAKEALIACFEHVTWDGDDGQDYINDLASALNMLELKGLTINKTSAEIRMSHTETLIATKIPSSAVGDITWSSSDDSVASVSSDGVVTPVAMGSATITASCGDFSASCSITVVRPLALLTGVHEFEDGSKIEISNGNHIKLTFAKTGEQQVCLTTLDGNISEDMTRAHNNGCTVSDVTIFSLSNSTLETTLTKTSDASLNYNCSIYAQPTGVGTNGFDLISSNLNTATKTTTVTGKTGDICNIGMWMKNAVIGAVYEADLEVICDGVRIL